MKIWIPSMQYGYLKFSETSTHSPYISYFQRIYSENFQNPPHYHSNFTTKLCFPTVPSSFASTHFPVIVIMIQDHFNSRDELEFNFFHIATNYLTLRQVRFFKASNVGQVCRVLLLWILCSQAIFTTRSFPSIDGLGRLKGNWRR